MVLHNSKYDKQAKKAHWAKKAKKSGKSIKEVMEEERAAKEGKSKSRMSSGDMVKEEGGDSILEGEQTDDSENETLSEHQAVESNTTGDELGAVQDQHQDQNQDQTQALSLFPEEDELDLLGEKERQREYLELAKEAARLRIEEDMKTGKNASEHVVRLEDGSEFDQLRNAIDRSKSLAHFKRRFGSSKKPGYKEDDFNDFLDEIDAGDSGEQTSPIPLELADRHEDNDELQDLLGKNFEGNGDDMGEHEKELDEIRQRQQYIDELLGL